MTYSLPLRFTILHFAQRLRMDGDTFMFDNSLKLRRPGMGSQRRDYTTGYRFRPEHACPVSQLSQNEGISLCDRDGMLKMSG